MTEYDNTNRFTLFRDEKRKSDKHPEYTGTINIDGVEYWLSAWVKESKNGRRFFSGSVKRKEAITIGPDEPQGGRLSDPPARRGSLKDQLDDDLPF